MFTVEFPGQACLLKCLSPDSFTERSYFRLKNSAIQANWSEQSPSTVIIVLFWFLVAQNFSTVDIVSTSKMNVNFLVYVFMDFVLNLMKKQFWLLNLSIAQNRKIPVFIHI